MRRRLFGEIEPEDAAPRSVLDAPAKGQPVGLPGTIVVRCAAALHPAGRERVAHIGRPGITLHAQRERLAGEFPRQDAAGVGGQLARQAVHDRQAVGVLRGQALDPEDRDGLLAQQRQQYRPHRQQGQ
jgi:hypothetical protein